MEIARENESATARGLRQLRNLNPRCLAAVVLLSMAGWAQAEGHDATLPLAPKSQAIVVADLFGDLRQQLENKAREVVKGAVASEPAPESNTPVEQPENQYPVQAVSAKSKAMQAEKSTNRQMPSIPLGDFLGKWERQGEKGLLGITPQKIIYTSWRKNDDGKLEKYTGETRWSNSDSDWNEEETFGLSRKQTTRAEILRRYEMALKRYKKTPTDFSISDPKLSRNAIQVMPAGTYQVMWSYFGGESGEEYIVDRDRMLAIKDDPYGFSVTLYNRVK